MTAPRHPTAKWLRALIKRGRLSQVRAAVMLDVNPRTFRRWVGGESAIPWMAAELLARMVDEKDSE